MKSGPGLSAAEEALSFGLWSVWIAVALVGLKVPLNTRLERSTAPTYQLDG
jgi:hypothetical protein